MKSKNASSFSFENVKTWCLKCLSILCNGSGIFIDGVLWIISLFLATPYLRNNLRTGTIENTLLWIGVPITRILVYLIPIQYIVPERMLKPGNKCERCILMILCAFFLMGSSLLFASAPSIFPLEEDQPNLKVVILAVGCFWILMITTQIYKKLCSSFSSPWVGRSGWALTIFFQYLGNFIAIAIILLFWIYPLDNILSIFTITSGLVLLCTIVCIISICFNNPTTHRAGEENDRPPSKDFKLISYGFIREYPWSIWVFGITYAMAIYCFVPIATDWLARILSNSAPGSPGYQSGLYDTIKISSAQVIGSFIGSLSSQIVSMWWNLRHNETEWDKQDNKKGFYCSLSLTIVSILGLSGILFMVASSSGQTFATLAFMLISTNGFSYGLFLNIEKRFPNLKRESLESLKNPEDQEAIKEARSLRDKIYLQAYGDFFYWLGALIIILLVPFIIDSGIDKFIVFFGDHEFLLFFGGYQSIFFIGGVFGIITAFLLIWAQCACIKGLSLNEELKLLGLKSEEEKSNITQSRPRQFVFKSKKI